MRRIAAVLPARGGSKRLPRKNIAPLMGKPLLAWVIDAVASSQHLERDQVWVSTDCADIAAEARSRGARVIERAPELAADDAWTEPVIQHAVEVIEAELGEPLDIVVWLNASLPEVLPEDVDRAIEWLVRDGLREVLSVGEDGRTHSAVRVLTRDALFQRRLSVHAGVLRLPYIDVHTADDLLAVTHRMQRRFAWLRTAEGGAGSIPRDIDWELDGSAWSASAWMSHTDLALLEMILRRKALEAPLSVLEWGSGRGTLHLCRGLRSLAIEFRWLSIESDSRYFRNHLASEVNALSWARVLDSSLRSDTAGPGDACATQLEFVVFDAGELRPYLAARAADRRANLDAYVACPGQTGRQFDVILVDGRMRRRCLLEAVRLLAPGGVVLLHDAWRPYYRCAFDAFPYHKRIGDILWVGAQEPSALQRLAGDLELNMECALNAPDR